MANRNVLIIQRRMTEYRTPLFIRLRELLAAAQIGLTVAYGNPSPSEIIRRDGGELPWRVFLPVRYASIGGKEIYWQPVPRQLLDEHDLAVITHQSCLLYNWWLLARRQRHRCRLAFWGHGDNFQARSRLSPREMLRTWSARQVDWYFAYTALSVQRLRKRGYPAQRITCLDNAVDTSSLQRWRQELTPQDTARLRASLGLQGEQVGAFLGSLHPDKRIDFLFTAADLLRDRIGNFELLLLGDGPLQGQVKNWSSARPWVRWLGARHGREKVQHLALAKLILNPGMVGLGILDSFALGLPLVTTDCHLHSPEIAYLRQGINGIMTADHPDAFVAGCAHMLGDDRARTAMAAACVEDAGRLSIEVMAGNFCAGIEQALAGAGQ
jgi:L-malate glycosyltransferase